MTTRRIELAHAYHYMRAPAYLAAVFLSGRFVGFAIFPVGSYPTFLKPAKLWMLWTCSSVPYLLRLASEYRRGRLYKHKPMTEWNGER